MAVRPTIQRLRALYRYDPIGGRIWSVRYRKYLAPLSNARVDYYKVADSILAWVLYYGEWPTNFVDHKDRDRTNIKLENLRNATATQNQQNKALNNKWGLKGICFNAKSAINPWMALIRINGKQTYLGSFPTREQAHEAYCIAAKEHHKEFAQLKTLAQANAQ